LPLKPDGAEVHLYDGSLKRRQDVQEAVLDIDVGSEDLQQCADAVIRLRAEYLYSRNALQAIHFNFTSGHPARFAEWAAGSRSFVHGNEVRWRMSAAPDRSYQALRQYLRTVFRLAGSYSLAKELRPVERESEIAPGAVVITGGFPGHAVILLDAAGRDDGSRVFLLGQSYMPAQEIHILKNLSDEGLSPWYAIAPREPVITPEWRFEAGSVKRFAE